MCRWIATTAGGLVAALALLAGGDVVAQADFVFEDGYDCRAWYRDVDGDGYGDAADFVVTCAPDPGYVYSPTDCDDDNSAINPGANDVPESTFTDLNCDGIDGDVARSYFVAPSGFDTNPGTRVLPFRTISFGVLSAGADALRRNVLVAEGTYGEAVTLANGVNLFGLYVDGTWARNVAAATTIQGAAATPEHDRTVIALSISQPTVFEGFVVRGALNTRPSGNSYAIYVSASGSNLAIRNNVIIAGGGGPGSTAASGDDGDDGSDGVGRSSNPALYDAKIATGTGFCNVSNTREFPNGAAGLCGSDVVDGGDGGGNECPPASDLTERSGLDGANGQPAVGGATATGGDAGDDAVLVASGTSCTSPPQSVLGADGADGANGANGAGVSGCTANTGTVSAGHWRGAAGTNGIAGLNGSGGAGGGGGGGAFCASCTENKHRLGGHAGGGGSGGCGGDLGAGGVAGGGAFGIFVVNSGAPQISNNTITRGSGGTGGNGGNGGAAGDGGNGAGGGVSAIFCAAAAGRGGDGGDGGDGSGGGGGCGGASYGIYTFNVTGTPNYCAPGLMNAIAGGSGGAGGAAGLSLGSASTPGATGALGLCFP